MNLTRSSKFCSLLERILRFLGVCLLWLMNGKAHCFVAGRPWCHPQSSPSPSSGSSKTHPGVCCTRNLLHADNRHIGGVRFGLLLVYPSLGLLAEQRVANPLTSADVVHGKIFSPFAVKCIQGPVLLLRITPSLCVAGTKVSMTRVALAVTVMACHRLQSTCSTSRMPKAFLLQPQLLQMDVPSIVQMCSTLSRGRQNIFREALWGQLRLASDAPIRRVAFCCACGFCVGQLWRTTTYRFV